MEPVKLSETLIGREVERLFSKNPGSHGGLYENPVTGGHFVVRYRTNRTAEGGCVPCAPGTRMVRF